MMAMFRVAISGIEFWTLDGDKARELIVSDGRELGERVVLDLSGGPFSHVVPDRGHLDEWWLEHDEYRAVDAACRAAGDTGALEEWESHDWEEWVEDRSRAMTATEMRAYLADAYDVPTSRVTVEVVA